MAKLFLLLVVVLVPFKWVYVVDKGICNGCGNCLYACTEGAISMVGGDAWIDPELCNGCGVCVYYCPRGAIYKEWYTGIEEDAEVQALRLEANPVFSGSAVLSGAGIHKEVILLDSAGRTVMRTESDTEGRAVFDVSSLPGGSYRIAAGEETVVLSII